eukprot:gene1781-2918_t
MGRADPGQASHNSSEDVHVTHTHSMGPNWYEFAQHFDPERDQGCEDESAPSARRTDKTVADVAIKVGINTAAHYALGVPALCFGLSTAVTSKEHRVSQQDATIHIEAVRCYALPHRNKGPHGHRPISPYVSAAVQMDGLAHNRLSLADRFTASSPPRPAGGENCVFEKGASTLVVALPMADLGVAMGASLLISVRDRPEVKHVQKHMSKLLLGLPGCHHVFEEDVGEARLSLAQLVSGLAEGAPEASCPVNLALTRPSRHTGTWQSTNELPGLPHHDLMDGRLEPCGWVRLIVSLKTN